MYSKHKFMRWARGRADNPLTADHLAIVEPYLARISEQEKLHLAWTFERVSDPDGRIERWLRQHIVSQVRIPGSIR
jgi:hypothetical protein